MSLETRIEKTFILPPLIAGNSSTVIKSVEEDGLAIRVHPDSLHVFYNNSLKEVWKFPAELVDFSLDTLYSPNVVNNNNSNMNNKQKYILVSTADGSVWRIQTPVQRNKRRFDTDAKSNNLNDNHTNSSRTLFSPPIITNVRSEHQIYKKASLIFFIYPIGICKIHPIILADVSGLLICCLNGELVFISTINQLPNNQVLYRPHKPINQEEKLTLTISNNSYDYSLTLYLLRPLLARGNGNYLNQDYQNFITLDVFNELLCSGDAYHPMITDQTDILITGTSKGWVSYQPLVFDTPDPIPFASMDEPMNAIYTLHINHENTSASNSNVNVIAHNAMILVGAQGTIKLLFVKENDLNSQEKVLFREYYVPGPVYSSTLYMNRLTLAVKDGRTMYLDFSYHVIIDGKLAPINSKSIDIPKNMLDLCYSRNSNDNGRLFAISKDGKLIRNTLTIENEQVPQKNPHFKLSTSEIRNALKKQIESISECSAKQRDLEIIQKELNSAIMTRNLDICELRLLRKNRAKNLNNKKNLFVCDCHPMTISTSLTGSVVQRTYLKVKLLSRLAINWNQEWEKDVEVNLRRFQFPISISVGLNFDFSFSSSSESSADIKSKQIYFPIQNLCYDILDFIRPCPENIIKQIQQRRHFAIGNSIPRYNAPMDGNFFATRKEFVETFEALLDRLTKHNKLEDTPLSLKDLFMSLRLGTVFINFQIGSSNLENGKGERHVASPDDSFKLCLSMLLGENTPNDQLKEIIKSTEYAVFITPFSLEPVTFNLSKVNDIRTDVIPVELKISCNSFQTLLQTEEAMLRRLLDFSRMFSNNGDPPHSLSNMMDIDEINQGFKQELDKLIKYLETRQSNKIVGSYQHVHNQYDTLASSTASFYNDDQLEAKFNEILSGIRKKLERIIIPGVIEF
ncbi:13074_t:CDS:10 [Ambispora gerdemannii]|uniref:13074_t:CDS:1 n=1 Tax=Ambispora gerdemannii TaxID=144530 RepID=A0A9N8ZSA4_9GLOM|nr:13074_t:CDS:10 [Ambispora gerdemannii]